MGLVGAGCRPAVVPVGPESEPSPVVRAERPRPAAANGRHVLVGEMCPTAAAGRPAVAPLVLRGTTWTDKPDELANTVERGATPRYTVFGANGRAGVFDVVGLADVAIPSAPGQPVAAGAYTGASPCAVPPPKDGQAKDAPADDPACTAALAGCGLALAELERPDDLVETPAFTPSTACVDHDALAIDIDGDHVVEAFPLDGVLDGIRGPAAEWSASPTPAAPCAQPRPQLYDIPLEVKAGGKPDPKATVHLHVLGVVDLDNDGRKEVVLALDFPTVRTIVVYSAVGMAQRLELVGEGPAFPR